MSVLIALILTHVLKPENWVWGIATAVLFAACFGAVYIMFVTKQMLGKFFQVRRMMVKCATCCFAAVVSGVVGYFLLSALTGDSHFLHPAVANWGWFACLGTTALVALAMLLVYALLCKLLRVRELDAILRRLPFFHR
jgi:magnesium-transporting ATPase (P-type)